MEQIRWTLSFYQNQVLHIPLDQIDLLLYFSMKLQYF
jgi:hypothetical protein